MGAATREEELVKRPAESPHLITDAARSQGDQLRRRQTRYVFMMSIRGVCLIVGAVLVTIKAPLLWIWLPICAVGMVLIPWLAVLLANDRPPKDRHRLANRWHRRPEPGRSPLLPSRTPAGGQVIDVEP